MNRLKQNEILSRLKKLEKVVFAKADAKETDEKKVVAKKKEDPKAATSPRS